ncbi:MAG: PEGA domain-containing protein [Bryobacteraceae bacterium]|jgi:hypothetical protein
MRCLLSLLLVGCVTPTFCQHVAERVLDADCSVVWRHTISTFAKSGFDPKTADRATGFATFSFREGQQMGRLNRQINSFTNAGANAFSGYLRFGIDNATFTAADEGGKCRVSAIFDFVGYKQNLFYKGWVKLGSKGVLEAQVLDELAEAVGDELGLKLSSAQITESTAKAPTENKPATEVAKTPSGPPKVTFTSDPPGAEVTVDGEYIGSTPTVELEQKDGTRIIQIRKRGYLVWERKLTLKDGDVRDVNAELELAPQDPSKPRIVGLE